MLILHVICTLPSGVGQQLSNLVLQYKCFTANMFLNDNLTHLKIPSLLWCPDMYKETQEEDHITTA